LQQFFALLGSQPGTETFSALFLLIAICWSFSALKTERWSWANHKFLTPFSPGQFGTDALVLEESALPGCESDRETVLGWIENQLEAEGSYIWSYHMIHNLPHWCSVVPSAYGAGMTPSVDKPFR